MVDAAALLGTWRMISWVRELAATGERTDALGPRPTGYLSYQPDGRVMAVVFSRDRAKPLGPTLSEEEKAGLFDTLVAYAGTYSVETDRVVHHIDASWNETWTGTDQVRFCKLDGDRLSLQGAPRNDIRTGEEVTYRMTFERCRCRSAQEQS